MKKILLLTFAMILLIPAGCNADALKIKPKAVIRPIFELGELTGDEPGEAQLYYDRYCSGGDVYDGIIPGSKVYVKDDVCLYLLGMGKINAASSLMALLTDERFDFSDAYFFLTGCAGGSYEECVMGDVVVVTAAVDFELGHITDGREIADSTGTTWFRAPMFDSHASKTLNKSLSDRVYNLVKDIKMKTTDKTRRYMSKAFDDAARAVRDPKVMRGTSVTSDSYWKGAFYHKNALLITKEYGCPDPYAVTEMENAAVASVLDRMGMLDRLIILRDIVNLDIFVNGDTPESLWDPNRGSWMDISKNSELADIFETARENNFKVGSVLIDAILDGRL